MSTINGYNPGMAPMAPARPTLPQMPMARTTYPTSPYTIAPTTYTSSSAGGVTIPGGKVFAEFDGGGLIDMAGDLAHVFNMAKTGIDAKPVNSALGQLWGSLKGLHGNGIFESLKGVVGGMIPLAARSGLFEGAISTVVNGYKYLTHSESLGTAGGNVVGDTMSGFAGGAGAALGGAICMAILPFAGPMGMILTGLAGICGFGLGSSMIRSTGIYNTIVNGVRSGMGG